MIVIRSNYYYVFQQARYRSTFRAARVKMTVSVLCAGLGLGASSTGRRDSFDRNTSAFSPSLEYSRAKWPQSYGALGKDPSVVCGTYSDAQDVRGTSQVISSRNILVVRKHEELKITRIILASLYFSR